MQTTYERGIEEGIERGIQRGIVEGIECGIVEGERRSALRQMEARFGPLSAEAKRRVEGLSPEAVAQLQLDILQAQTIEDLHLDL